MDAQNILTQFGISGLVFGFLWPLVKALVQDRFNDFKNQITDLKNRVDECEQDREELWNRLLERDPRPRPPKTNGSGANPASE